MKFTQTLCLFLSTAILLGACMPGSAVAPGSSTPSLVTVEPPQFISILTWQSADQPCIAADFSLDEVSFGECIGPHTSVSDKGQAERLTKLLESFAPFTASTPAGTVNFNGRGTTVATKAEQHAIAEWARLNFEAAQLGNPDKAWSLAFSYHHNSQGCEDVAISFTGLARVSVCDGILGQTYLTAYQLEQLYGWIDSLTSEDVTSQPDQSPSTSTFVIKLNGTASKQADGQAIRSMVEFANEIFLQVSFSVNAPTEKNEAEQALRDYLTALHSNNYDLAAKLYGGDINLLQTWNPDIAADLPALLQRACTQNGLRCLLPRSITYRGPDSGGGYQFYVEFNNDDGILFHQGPGEEISESISVFLFRVVKAESNYIVMDLPPYIP